MPESEKRTKFPLIAKFFSGTLAAAVLGACLAPVEFMKLSPEKRTEVREQWNGTFQKVLKAYRSKDYSGMYRALRPVLRP